MAETHFTELLSSVHESNLDASLSLRNNRKLFYEQDRKVKTVSQDYQKKVSLQRRLRRGKFMHQPYFKTE